MDENVESDAPLDHDSAAGATKLPDRATSYVVALFHERESQDRCIICGADKDMHPVRGHPVNLDGLTWVLREHGLFTVPNPTQGC